MFVFIVRPFGSKDGIDFEKVQDDLIAPAMERLDLLGGTTAPIARAGNIRADMFELLAKSDLVIADISIHNANVFYELGARHALREKRTFLIRSRSDEVPFDLRTDRYLEYDKEAPSASVEALVEGLRQTIEKPATDSPIFQLVPKLKPQDWTRLVAVPQGFSEEVARAAQDKHLGDLQLLAHEARAFDWASEGLRLVGRAQFDLKDWEGVRETWEAVRERLEGDLEADLKLGTVYQRLGDLASSDGAVRRGLASPDIGDRDRAEAYALLGSNEKSRWMTAWKDLSPEEKPQRALGSRYLYESQKYYSDGFSCDLNHYYAGVNALALQTILLELARNYPDSWATDFDDDDDAKRALKKMEGQCHLLEGAVTLSVERELKRLEKHGGRDRWADITHADLTFLTNANPMRVARAYQRALGGAKDFYFDSCRRQLGIYVELNVLTDNVKSVLDEITRLEQQAGIAHKETGDDGKETHVILFTGHRIDAPDRAKPRFPAAKQDAARNAIKAVVQEEQARISGELLGMAGGASGGDLLFHEVCEELGIPTRLFLAVPSNDYVVASVQVPGQPQWVNRFRSVEKRCSPRTLSRNSNLPGWLSDKPNYSIWQRNNLWTLYNALAFGGKNVTLVALWNGEAGDGPGGTEDMIKQAKARGAVVNVLDTGTVFGL